jgi:hypothetical protein
MERIKNFRIFRRTHALEVEIDEFLEKLTHSALAFSLAIKSYVELGYTEDFEDKLQHVRKLETDADNLRRSIEAQLYSRTLIPESRGDVLGLLENLDNIINLFEGALWQFSIEKPEIAEIYRKDFGALTDMTIKTVESVILASHAFFRNISEVNDHNSKVRFYETEADKISTKLKRAIFNSDMDLAHKAQLRNFVEHIDNPANWAEDVADRLSIYAIKRSI